jgi:polyisoprenoid-binding protein YceI
MKKILAILAIFSSLIYAQSTVEVDGTSTLHNWKMVSHDIKVDMNQTNGKFTKLVVTFAAKSLKSGDEGLDNTAYKAMKADKHKIVSFSLIKQNDDGTLLGAFTSNNQEMNNTIKPDVIEAGHVAGSFKVKMTDFGIKPPTFLFGAMSAGDELTIKYDIKKP